ncbi:hypothetical protein NUW54_g9730 [Trametes sanguinea]|uniref:Uncharacterized protein n=1 Tax=Trametes sanguinea TaxID=158606 RepID=A0ACC1P5G4_9APHY|nr:hypothetical protein NUW54_g9730 [Trametes sanguinea]
MIPLIDIALSLLETSKAALEVVPVPGVSIAVDALIVFLDIIKGLKTNQRAVEELVQELLSLSAAVNNAIQHAQSSLPLYPGKLSDQKRTDPTHTMLSAALQWHARRINKLQIELLRLATEATKLQSGTRWRKLLRSSQDLRVIRRLKREAKAILVEFHLGCNMSMEALLYDVAARLACGQSQQAGFHSAM